MLDRVLEGEQTALRLRLVPNARVLDHAARAARVLLATDNRREHRARRVVARDARLAHAGAVVDHQRPHILVVLRIDDRRTRRVMLRLRHRFGRDFLRGERHLGVREAWAHAQKLVCRRVAAAN